MEGNAMSLHITLGGEKSAYGSVATVIISALLIITFAISSAQAAALKQKTFKSPEDAVKAMVDAVKANDTKQLTAIFGPGSQDLISSGDEVADKTGRERFATHYQEKNRLEQSTDKKAILYVGNDDWPFSIPIVRAGKVWRFDTKAGRQEILARRIGKNELSAIQVCLAYTDAQREYALKDRNSNGLLEYAQKLVSEPGKRDGLYWEAIEGEEQSPLGPLAAKARSEGYGAGKSGDKPAPYHGYFYKILTAQGKNAPGGAYDYIVNGKMIGGFALVAYPATFGNSGIMTFIVNQEDVVYQKNLGKNTGKIAQAMKIFDPDKTWKKVD
jgi:hypothetical protein